MRFAVVLLMGMLCLQPALAQEHFPADWSGSWSGTLEIYNATGKLNQVAMLLEIHVMDTSTSGRYFWGMAYGSKEQDWRPYELVPLQPERGLWQLDEKNGIRMES